MWTKNKVAFICKKGGEAGPNQDNLFCLIQESSEQKTVALGVFDGIGEFGQVVSCIAQRLFSKVIKHVHNFSFLLKILTFQKVQLRHWLKHIRKSQHH